MCGCGGAKKEVSNVFAISDDLEGLVQLISLDSVKRRIRTPSGNTYFAGGRVEIVFAFPDDVEYLTSLIVKNNQILEEA